MMIVDTDDDSENVSNTIIIKFDGKINSTPAASELPLQAPLNFAGRFSRNDVIPSL